MFIKGSQEIYSLIWNDLIIEKKAKNGTCPFFNLK